MALKTYVFLHNYEAGSWDAVRDYLDAHPYIVNWMYFLPNAFLVATGLSAKELSEQFREATGPGARFLILSAEGERHGWLPRPAWDLMRFPGPPESPPPPPPPPPGLPRGKK